MNKSIVIFCLVFVLLVGFVSAYTFRGSPGTYTYIKAELKSSSITAAKNINVMRIIGSNSNQINKISFAQQKSDKSVKPLISSMYKRVTIK